MITARDQFLKSGHYAPIAERLQSVTTQLDPRTSPGLVVDLAGGTGYYLAHVLDALPHRHGLCIDLSTPALRRAVHAHPRVAALGSDVWQRLPLADHSVATVVSVFGPRNLPEVARILAPSGIFVVAMPTTIHLQELIGPLGMLTVDQNKSERLASGLDHFDQLDTQDLTYLKSLSHTDVTALVSMGPSAHHVPPAVLAQRLQVLPDPTAVTVSARIAAYRVS
jgi:23S rRNA (guanine745-N1)-methyltransferase